MAELLRCTPLPRISRFASVARLAFGHNDLASPAERLFQRTARLCSTWSDLDLSLRDGLWIGLLAPVCVYLAWQVYRTRKQGFRLARWLLVFRCAAFLLLLALLMEPVLALTLRRERKPLVAVLVDDSESMRIEDDGQRRGDLAIELLRSGVFETLESRARVARYRFSEWLAPLPSAALDSLRFDGRATDLAAALDLLREEDGRRGNGRRSADFPMGRTTWARGRNGPRSSWARPCFRSAWGARMRRRMRQSYRPYAIRWSTSGGRCQFRWD